VFKQGNYIQYVDTRNLVIAVSRLAPQLQ